MCIRDSSKHTAVSSSITFQKKTEYGQMTHQTKACKPQKTKMAVNSSSVVPRLLSWTLFYPFERRSRRYGAPHETLRAKCCYIVIKNSWKKKMIARGVGLAPAWLAPNHALRSALGTDHLIFGYEFFCQHHYLQVQTLTTKDCKGPQTNMPENVGSIKTWSAKMKSRHIKFFKQNTAMLIVLREN